MWIETCTEKRNKRKLAGVKRLSGNTKGERNVKGAVRGIEGMQKKIGAGKGRRMGTGDKKRKEIGAGIQCLRGIGEGKRKEIEVGTEQ